MSRLADGGTFARLVDLAVYEPSMSVVELRVGRLRRPLQMELRVTPWRPGHSARALVELVPHQRRVPLTGAYFEAGHRLLDHIIDELVVREARPPAPLSPRRAGS